MKTSILAIALLTLILISCGLLDTPSQAPAVCDSASVDTIKVDTTVKSIGKVLPPIFDTIKK